jgi:hypothetical protein
MERRKEHRLKLELPVLGRGQDGASRVQFRIMWMSLSGEAGKQAPAMEPPIFGMGVGIGLPKVYEMVGTG